MKIEYDDEDLKELVMLNVWYLQKTKEVSQLSY